MDSFLLATKLQIPPQPRRSVYRERLIDALESNISHHKLLLLAAPPGYGKTTLLSQWALCSHVSIAWLSLDEGDNELEDFLRYLLAAWEAAQSGVRQGPLGLLLDAAFPNPSAILAAMVNTANEASRTLAFVLDDYHLIQEPAIHDAISFLLDHSPDNLHLVLSSRGEPPLSVARRRARRAVFELQTQDLAFSLAETGEFLNEIMALELPQDELVRLQDRLEGWIAGIQLVALTLQRRLTAPDELSVSGRHRLIADYLSEDVLGPLPEDMRRFLLQSSILEQLSGPLCDTVTGRQDGQQMLERLEHESLFLVPLDDERQWFRYHHLFGDYLRVQLRRRWPHKVSELHQRAARWFLSHDLPDQAFRHAREAGLVDLTAEIIDRHFPVKLMTGDVQTIRRWLDALPEAWAEHRPELGLAQAFFLAFTGDFASAVRRLDQVEQGLGSDETGQHKMYLARTMAGRCLVACLQNDLPQAEAYAQRALQDLPQTDVFYRAGIHHSLGDLYRQNGRWQNARSHYQRVLEFTGHPSARFRRAHIYGALADLDLEKGRLTDAAGNWRKALAAIQEPAAHRIPLPVTGWVYIRLGEILYEWNELAQAQDRVSQGLERAQLGGDTRSLIAGNLLASRLHIAGGDVETAAKRLEQARPLVEDTGFSPWLGRFERLQIELWLAQSKLKTAVRWSDEKLEAHELETRPGSQVAQLAMARVLILKGDRAAVDRALAFLTRLLQTSEAESRMGDQIEALALQALAYWRRGDRAAAMSALEHALRLARPEGYVRLLVDLGLPIARLLQEAHARHVMPDYVETLLAAFSPAALPPHKEEPLPEPLTAREQEVLELMAAGLTNREIAEVLVIAPGTVKKHASNIYGKLHVDRRTEAVARAREMHLIE